MQVYTLFRHFGFLGAGFLILSSFLRALDDVRPEVTFFPKFLPSLYQVCETRLNTKSLKTGICMLYTNLAMRRGLHQHPLSQSQDYCSEHDLILKNVLAVYIITAIPLHCLGNVDFFSTVESY